MNVAAILSFVQLAIAAAPGVKKVYEDGAALVKSLFSSGLITKAEQDKLMSWADAHQAAVLAGDVPPEFKVE